jgi:hypothetical protein
MPRKRKQVEPPTENKVEEAKSTYADMKAKNEALRAKLRPITAALRKATNVIKAYAKHHRLPEIDACGRILTFEDKDETNFTKTNLKRCKCLSEAQFAAVVLECRESRVKMSDITPDTQEEEEEP